MSKTHRLFLALAIFALPFGAAADNPIAYRVGPGAQMTCAPSVPNHISTRGTMWCKSTDGNKLYYTDPSGTDSVVGSAGGGSETLQQAYTAGAAGGGAILETSSGGPLALSCGADANGGLTVKANSPSQSADLIATQDSAGTPRFEIVPADSGQTQQCVITTALNGQAVILKMVNSLLSTMTQWAQGSLLQMAIGGSTWQIFTQGFATQVGQFDSNGVSSPVGIGANIASVSGQQAGSSLLATTAATSSGTQQNSPGLLLQAQAWNTSALAGQTVKWLCQVIPGAASNPVTGQLSCYNNDNGGGFTERFRVSDGGNVIAIGSLFAGTGGTGTVQAAQLQPNTASTAVSAGTNSNTSSVAIGRSSIATTIAGSFVLAPQANTMGATVTITPSSGSVAKQTYTSATNVTSMTISAGTDGQELTVALIQPAAGTAATMTTTWTNVNFTAGAAPSFTATLGKRDLLTFVYDGATSKWYEKTRALNLSN